jgi:hypothetical protein
VPGLLGEINSRRQELRLIHLFRERDLCSKFNLVEHEYSVGGKKAKKEEKN